MIASWAAMESPSGNAPQNARFPHWARGGRDVPAWPLVRFSILRLGAPAGQGPSGNPINGRLRGPAVGGLTGVDHGAAGAELRTTGYSVRRHEHLDPARHEELDPLGVSGGRADVGC